MTAQIGGSPAYRDRVVGFVDILGFGDLVRRADKNPVLRSDIIEALGRVRSVAAPTEGETGLRAQNFSDSLILSAANTPDGLWHLLLSMDSLAWNLLQIGVLVRGGVTIGGMQHDPDLVFGVGVNEAYRLESTVARTPRIVLGAQAVAAANRYANDHAIWEAYRNSRLLRDRDGVWFLHYLAELGIFNRQNDSRSEASRHPLYSMGQGVHRIMQEKLEQTLEHPDVYAKFEWFARYWNAEVATPVGLGSEYTLEPLRLAGMEPRGKPYPFRSS